MLQKSRNRQGFTLVEVIVVAVIVAILSAVAVPLYLGYINSAKVSTANNIAGAAASYLASARNSGNTTDFTSPLTGSAAWSYTPDNSTTAVTFKMPDTTASVTVNGTMAAGGSVTCTYKTKVSSAFNF